MNKAFYISEGREASKWVREATGGLRGKDAPQMSSGLAVKTSGKTMRGRSLPGELYYLTAKSNNVMSATEFTFTTSSCSAQGNGGTSVLPDNWRRSIALFAARKLTVDTWTNHEDEYLIPSIPLGLEAGGRHEQALP